MAFSGILAEGVPARSPARCICCGQDTRPLADSGVDIPGWGTVQICVGTGARPGCLLQVARAAGCLLPGEKADLERKVATLESQVEALTIAVQRVGEPEPVAYVSADEVIDKLSVRLGA